MLADGVVMFGPRRLDAAANRANALKLLSGAAGKASHAMRSTGLSVVASPGGHSAWMFDVVYADTQPLAVTGVLTSTSGIWAVHAAMLAEVASRTAVRAQSSKDAIVPPGSSAAGQIDPGASEVIDQFKRGLGEPQVWATELMAGEDSMWIGPTSGELARGKDAITRVWKARQKSNVRLVTTSEFTAGRTPDGELAWLSVAATRVADDAPDPLPQRLFAVYAKAGGGWRLASLHEALALAEPGAGVAFKKGIAPGPAAAPPPPSPAAQPAPAEIEIEATASNDPKPDEPKKLGKAKRAKTRTPAGKKPATAKKKPRKKQPRTAPPPPPGDDTAATQ